jgi:SAM-dependent MidA family methyltransferase
VSPIPGAADRSGVPGLVSDIVARIEREGPVPFDLFMDAALYGERGGYYERGPAAIGPAGDFYTSSEISSAFGVTLAKQIVECAARLDEERLDVVELGAGRGTMASDILDTMLESHPALYHRLTYWIVDRSRGMRDAQESLLARHSGPGKVRWAIGPEAVRPDGIVGCVIANEFYDALPVRVVARREGELMERCVGLVGDPPSLGWAERPATAPELVEYAARYGLAPAEGAIAEAGLSARAWAGRIARAIRRGFQIAIDYGDRADRLYDPRVRPAGTLLGYRRHQVVDDPFSNVGEQDLTAHVNFSAIEDAGAESDLESLGLTTQDRFLISLGLADRIAELAASTDPASIRRRLAMMALIHPEMMGRVFRVLVQAKGVVEKTITGLRDPFARTVPAGGGE